MPEKEIKAAIREAAEKEKDSLLTQAKSEAEIILTEAREEAASRRDSYIQKLEKKVRRERQKLISELSFSARKERETDRVISRTLKNQKHH